tara:strand:+ start:749 stop:2518 length:1770 start_codon:yes stop_codon:yes gene_type:complete
MATEVVNLKITVDSSGAVNSVNKLKTNLGGVNKGLNTTGVAAAASFGKLKTLVGAVGIVAFGKSVMNVAAEFEDLQNALNATFGSVEAGSAAFDRVQEIATKLPLDIDLITSAFVQLKGAGVEPTEEMLLGFSDAASISTDKVGTFQASIDLFTRTMQGGLGLVELQRLADRGLPVFDILHEKLQLARLDVSKFGQSMEGAEKIRTALFEGLNERFGGATEVAMASLSTKTSVFKDEIKKAAVAFGGKGKGGFLDGIADATSGMTDFIAENQELIAALGRVVGTGLNLVIDAFNILFDIIRKVVDIVKAAVDTFLGFIQTIQDVATSIIEFKDKVVGKFEEMKNGISDKMTSIKDTVVGAFSDTEEEVVGGSIVPDMVDGVLREFGRMERETIASTRSMSEGTTHIMRTEFSDSNLQHILVDPVDRATTSVSGSFSRMESSISSNLSSVLKGTKSFKDALIDLGSQAITGQLGNLISGGGFGGGSGGGLGSIIGMAGSLFGGFFNKGGKLPKGKFGIAGESGPELITGPATITPLAKDRTGVSPVFNFNITGNLGTDTTGTVTQTDLNRMASRVLEESLKIMSTQGRFA